MSQPNDLRACYDRQYSATEYCGVVRPEEHGHYRELKQFIDRYQLSGKRCLEVGCGRGAFQDLVEDYTGVDISNAVRSYLHKPFHVACATRLPFPDDHFDALWTIAVLEHVPDPECAFEEMRRVLKPNGLLFLAPAWHCRSYTADGYPIRPYRDLNLAGKMVKASIPLREWILFRAASVFPVRLARYLEWLIKRGPLEYRYRKPHANYKQFWMSDSDACNAMDPYEAILWFLSRGDECVSYRGRLSQFLVKSGAIIFRIQKRAEALK